MPHLVVLLSCDKKAGVTSYSTRPLNRTLSRGIPQQRMSYIGVNYTFNGPSSSPKKFELKTWEFDETYDWNRPWSSQYSQPNRQPHDQPQLAQQVGWVEGDI
jgi:hypothetical protein